MSRSWKNIRLKQNIVFPNLLGQLRTDTRYWILDSRCKAEMLDQLKYQESSIEHQEPIKK